MIGLDSLQEAGLGCEAWVKGSREISYKLIVF